MNAPSPTLLQALVAASGARLMLFIFLSILSTLITIVLEYGLAAYFLRVFRREQAGIATLFTGFSRAGSVIGSALLVGIFTGLWTMLLLILPAVVGAVLGLLQASAATAAIAIGIMAIAVTVGMFIIVLRYVMVPYVIMNEERGALASIRRSKELMRGNKWRCFVLGLSFIGWVLLVMLIMLVPACIGVLFNSFVMQIVFGALGFLASLPLVLWLETYFAATFAGFYCIIAGEPPADLSDPAAPVTDEPWNL